MQHHYHHQQQQQQQQQGIAIPGLFAFNGVCPSFLWSSYVSSVQCNVFMPAH
jgi:hypothetical protein